MNGRVYETNNNYANVKFNTSIIALQLKLIDLERNLYLVIAGLVLIIPILAE